MKSLLECIEGHNALRIPLFESMAAAKPLSHEFLALYFNEVLAVCRAAGKCHPLASALQQNYESAAAAAVMAMAQLRTGETEQLQTMAGAMLAGSGLQLTDHAQLGSTLVTCHGLVPRPVADTGAVFSALGAWVAVQHLINHHLMPGQLQAFVLSGWFSIDDPRMAHLVNQNSQSSVATQHDELIRSVILPFEREWDHEMNSGAGACLEHVEWWLQDLLHHLVYARR